MTLDTLTRASAELKHVQLKGSLAQARSEFRDRFKQDAELFRTLPLASAAVPLSPIAHAQASASPTAATAASPQLLGEDLVRTERLTQCCKRVRVWKRQTTNPLLAYRHRSSGAGSATSGAAPGATSGGPSGSSKPGGNTSAADHRMHLSLLMTMIVDMYEQKMTAEVSATTVLLPVAGISESFPEFAVKYVSARATSRRAAVDQVHTMVAMLLQPSTHPRVRTFAALCGLDGAYNPPEKLRAFLHMIESVHRLKVASVAAAAATTPAPGAAPTAVGVKAEDASSLAEVVFYNLGVSLAVALKVIAELFEEEYYWNFRFWHSHFAELRLQYAWPAATKVELEEKTLALTTVSRSAALNAAKKVDTDAFLELLLDTWTQRAKTLCDMLEAATNEEEQKSTALLANKQAAQDARGHIAPVSVVERRLFDELVEEFWNAEVPWTTDPKVQRRATAACEGARSVSEMASLYRKHVAELDDRKKAWLWAHSPWDPDWEWGLLVVRGREAEPQAAATASPPPVVLPHGATDSATIAAATAGRAI